MTASSNFWAIKYFFRSVVYTELDHVVDGLFSTLVLADISLSTRELRHLFKSVSFHDTASNTMIMIKPIITL